MLKQLNIKNIAIIESLSLDFQKGLTVITGESGSGKSILLDAIALSFGAKASPKDVLRTGAERGQVELLFELGSLSENSEFQALLEVYGIALLSDESELLLSREFTIGGSRSRINGIPVPREGLEQLRPWIIDLHGQHELTSLFQKDKQRHFLDAFGGASVLKLKKSVAEAYNHWQCLSQQLLNLQKARLDAERQRDFLVFQLQELSEASLSEPDEDTQLRQALERLSHADKLVQITSQSALILSEGDQQRPCILDQLGKLEKRLNEGASYDSTLGELLERLQGSFEELRELSSALSNYAERVDVDPERIAEYTERLDLLEKLKRKYGPTLEAVIEQRNSLEQQLNILEASEQDASKLEAAIAEKEQILNQLCIELRSCRQELATQLKLRLMEQLQILAMPAANFDIQISETGYSKDGTESIEFVFSANPGEPLRPLAKVASGGEMSRVLLALKVLTAKADGLLTLVFDEIDTGISGPTAKAVAEKLGELSQHIQVLAITHQPMIAAMGQQHWHVEKQVSLLPSGIEAVNVAVQALAQDEAKRLQVLSRLVSGLDTSDEAVEKFIARLREQALAFYETLETSACPV